MATRILRPSISRTKPATGRRLIAVRSYPMGCKCPTPPERLARLLVWKSRTWGGQWPKEARRPEWGAATSASAAGNRTMALWIGLSPERCAGLKEFDHVIDRVHLYAERPRESFASEPTRLQRQACNRNIGSSAPPVRSALLDPVPDRSAR